MTNTRNKPAPVARAIDAGFGVIKFTRAAMPHELKIAVNGVVCDSFLSRAIDVNEDQERSAVDGGRKRDTRLVSYKNRSYEIGKDVVHATVGTDFGRSLTRDYYESDIYHALMRGALAYMEEDHIDALVLGLPMNFYENKECVSRLQNAYTGLIDLGHGRRVLVRKAIVHPQPFGGYISLGHDLKGINSALQNYPGSDRLESIDDLGDMNILIVDPGEYTLDWLLMTPGGHAQRVSSAAGDAGRHRVLRDVYELVCKKVGRKLGLSFMTDIDEALRFKKPLRVSGVKYPLDGEDFMLAIERAVEDPVRQMLESLREADDRIDLIAVMGGSPVEVATAIKRARPHIPLYCPSEASGQSAPLFANVRGFQEWAEEVSALN